MKEIHWEDRAVLRVKEVCELLGIKRITLHKWCKAGYFPRPVQLGPRATAFRVSDVKAFVASLPPDSTYRDDD